MKRAEHQFWDWIRDEGTGERVLFLEGPIDSDSFWGDEVTPKAFRDQLESGTGDITVWINSPGGNVFAAAEIYTMLMDYKGKVTVKIASIAASAASVIAMAGDSVEVSPTAMLMIHDPATIAMGNARDFERTISTLREVKESIINAYQAKTGLSRAKIAKLMENETWMNARAALGYGFVDRILFIDDKDGDEDPDEPGTGEEPEEPDKPGTEEEPEEPDEDDPDKEDPDEEKAVKKAPKAYVKPEVYSFKKLSDISACRCREYGRTVHEAQEPPAGDGSGDSAAMYATYEAMLKQLEMIKDW